MSDDEEDLAFELTPHDALFRRALEHLDDAKSAVRAALPESLATRIDWSGFAPAAARFTSTELRQRESDLAFTAPLDGTTALIRLLFEHQSASLRDMALRVHRTQGSAWELACDADEPVMPVIVIVVHHGEKPWRAPRSMLARLDVDASLRAEVAAFTPASEYIVDDLALLDAHALVRRAELTHIVRIAYFLLQLTRASPALERELRLLRTDLRRLRDNERGARFLASVLRYTLYVGRGDERAILKEMRKAVGDRVEEGIVGEIAERWIAKGEARGEARGIAIGEARRLVKTLKRQLELRFGPLSASAAARLERASITELEHMTDLVLTASNLEAVIGDDA